MSIWVRSITDLMSKEAIGKALTEYYNTENKAQKEDRTLFGFSPDTAIDNMGTDNFFLEKQFKCNIFEKTF